MANNGNPVPPPPSNQGEVAQPPPALRVHAQAGGIVISFIYDYLMVQAIVPEGSIDGLIAAMKKQKDLIPRVIL